MSGVRPRSFQRSMAASKARAGHFLSSRSSATMSCFSRRSWSSVSRMVKLGVRPTTSAWRRSSRAASAWKVPSHQPSTGRPMRAEIRSFISRAALLVKVTASSSCGRALPVIRIWPSRVVSTRVLPVPAPGQDQDRAFGRLDGFALEFVQQLEIGSGHQGRVHDPAFAGCWAVIRAWVARSPRQR